MKKKILNKLVAVVLILLLMCISAGCGTSSTESLKKKLIGKEFWSLPKLTGYEQRGYNASCVSILFLDENTAVIFDFDTSTVSQSIKGDFPGIGSDFNTYDEFKNAYNPTWFEIDDDDFREWDILEDSTFSIEGNLYFSGYHTWSENETNEDTWFLKNGNLRIGDYEFTSKCPIEFKDNDHKYDVEKLLKEYEN